MKHLHKDIVSGTHKEIIHRKILDILSQQRTYLITYLLSVMTILDKGIHEVFLAHFHI